MTSPYQLVIFDFDGTLADSFPWISKTLNGVAKDFGFKEIREEDIPTLRTLHGRQLMKHLGIRWWKMPFIVRRMRKLAYASAEEIRLFPGVGEMLNRLADAGIELAVVTSNSEEIVRAVLGPELSGRIRYYSCGASMFGKHANFRKVLKQSGVPPAKALSVGDELRDLDASRKAGIPFGAVAWGFAHVDALRKAGPAELFLNMDEIADVVLRS